MMKLGRYSFSVDTAAYGRFERSAAYRWAAQERHGREAALQYLGPGDETVSLSGVIHPHFRGGLGQVADMRREAGRGTPLLLVDGRGNVLGRWVILSVAETHGVLFNDGVPRTVEFTLNLRYFGRV